MKFKFDFGKLKLALLIVVMLLGIAAIIVNALFLAGVGILETTVPAVAGTSIACSVLILVLAAVILFNSFYKITSEKVILCMGFFVEKIEINQITDIKQDAIKKDTYLVFGEDGINSIRIMVKKDKINEFIDELRKQNSNIIISNFNEPKDKEEDNNDKNI